jgi:hypothetical protein
MMAMPKNIQYTNLIKAGGRLREFNFRRSLGSRGPMFTVDVANERGDRYYLIFRFEHKAWVLENINMEPWINDVLPQIRDAIHPYE